MKLDWISKSDYQKLKILTQEKRFKIFKAVWKSRSDIPLRTLAEKLHMDINLVAMDVALMVDYGVLKDSGTGKNAKLSVPPETRDLIEAI